ncbi:RING-type E3 ubiquitin-protein ligase PPIL2 [Lampetra fluviatilis]
MGKRQHQKDKLYITCAEWTHLYGGKKPDGPKSDFRRLSFDRCSLSMLPFEHPMCTPDGIVFDFMNIFPWIKKYGTHPSTGEKLDIKSLLKLNFHKNADGKYSCPVLFNVFTDNSHIVAIKTTGNVFSYEAVDKLNIKGKNFLELITNEPFTRKDIITLQDPQNLDKFNLTNMHHIKHKLKIPDEEDEKARQKPDYHLKSTNQETRETLAELYRDYKGDKLLASTAPLPNKKIADKFNEAHYSTGHTAAALMSTTYTPQTQSHRDVVDEDIVRFKYVQKKKKGYVRMLTNMGELNLELHCGMVPKTCENFILLCQKGYYDGTIFHRSIRNFMIQGGDPTGTGKGGESAWGKPFKDEFKPNLCHQGRGVLSMANSGPNSNGSQFFITFRSCTHLDRKHAVFGRMIGGMEVLHAIEKIEANPKTDRPEKEIKIEKMTVLVNPFEEGDALLAADRQKALEEDEELEKSRLPIVRKPVANPQPKTYRSGIGKYIDMAAVKRRTDEESVASSSGAAGPSSAKKLKNSSSR